MRHSIKHRIICHSQTRSALIKIHQRSHHTNVEFQISFESNFNRHKPSATAFKLSSLIASQSPLHMSEPSISSHLVTFRSGKSRLTRFCVCGNVALCDLRFTRLMTTKSFEIIKRKKFSRVKTLLNQFRFIYIPLDFKRRLTEQMIPLINFITQQSQTRSFWQLKRMRVGFARVQINKFYLRAQAFFHNISTSSRDSRSAPLMLCWGNTRAKRPEVIHFFVFIG